MKKLLAALILGTVALSSTMAPARAQQSVPAALGGGTLSAGAIAGIVSLVVITTIAVSNDDDDVHTATTSTP